MSYIVASKYVSESKEELTWALETAPGIWVAETNGQPLFPEWISANYCVLLLKIQSNWKRFAWLPLYHESIPLAREEMTDNLE